MNKAQVVEVLQAFAYLKTYVLAPFKLGVQILFWINILE